MASGADLIPLQDSSLPDLRAVHLLGPVRPDRALLITVHVRLASDRFYDDSFSPDDTHAEIMTPEEFERQFGASDEDLKAVADYLDAVGLKNIQTSSAECVVEAVATADQIPDAFGVELMRYESGHGNFYGYEGEIKIPAELDGIIEAVNGLDSLVQLSRVRAEESCHDCGIEEPELDGVGSDVSPHDDVAAKGESHRHGHSHDHDEPRVAASRGAEPEVAASRGAEPEVAASRGVMLRAAAPPDEAPLARSVSTEHVAPSHAEPTGGLGQAGQPVPPHYKFYFPSELARLYDFPSEYDGTGETIGIVSMDGHYEQSDIAQYFAAQHMRPPQIEVATIGPPRPSLRHLSPEQREAKRRLQMMHNGELTLDLEVAGSMAPGAKLVVYRVAPGTPQPYLKVLKYAMMHPNHRPTVLAISYGMAESMYPPNDLKISNKWFAAATRMGVTICASSGDAGSASRDYDRIMTRPPGPHVNFPASSPWVLACGGTAIETSGDRIVREYAWNDLDQCRLATAGGISRIFERPAYQRGLTLPKNPSDRRGFDGRGVPDVAANASPTSGYHVLINGKWDYTGGTSATAPLWGALIARLNQAVGRRLGFIHPYLYRLAGTPAFRDISEGSNGYYKAGPGWDACTGIGVPVGRALLEGLKQELARLGVGATGETKPAPDKPDSDLSHVVGSANYYAAVARQAASIAQSAASTHHPYRFRGS